MKTKLYREKKKNGELYVMFTTRAGLDQFAKDAGWEDAAEFEDSMITTFEELRDTWFTISMGRVFTLD